MKTGDNMNRLQNEILKRKLSIDSSTSCKRSAKASARNILQYGKAGVDAFNNFSTPKKTEASKLRASSIEIMTYNLSSAKSELRRLVSMRRKGVKKPAAAIYMARARRMNNGVTPLDVTEALSIIIKEQIDYSRSIVLSARQSRIASS